MIMINILLPYIKLYRHYFWQVCLGLFLVILALSATVFLLSFSGWFLAATAYVGVAGLYTFNYILPAAGVRGAAIFRTVARYFERLVNHNITFHILADLRQSVFNKITPLSIRQLSLYQKGDLLNRFISDIDHLDHLYLKLFVPLISGVIVSFLLFIGLSFFDLTIATIFLVILLLAILTLPILFYRAGEQIGRHISEERAQYRQLLMSYLQGQAELTIFNAKNAMQSKINELEVSWQQNQKKQANLMALSTALILLIVTLLMGIAFVTLTTVLPGESSVLITFFIFSALSVAEILTPISNAFIFLGEVVSSAKRMNQLMELKPEIQFPEKGIELNDKAVNIECHNLTFQYPNQVTPVFEHLNFSIQANEHIALIGQTGCGKSTLLNLFTRSWEPTQGEIRFNGQLIEQFSESSLRKMMSVVPQVITIFNDSLRANLTLANPSATDQQLIDVLKQVELDKLLETDLGLELELGEKGRALSGGEKRRIGIARAILHDAPLILMDEPTESLDHETEQTILALLKKRFQHKTLLMITHRLDAHHSFDRVFKLEEGKLIEQYS